MQSQDAYDHFIGRLLKEIRFEIILNIRSSYKYCWKRIRFFKIISPLTPSTDSISFIRNQFLSREKSPLFLPHRYSIIFCVHRAFYAAPSTFIKLIIALECSLINVYSIKQIYFLSGIWNVLSLHSFLRIILQDKDFTKEIKGSTEPNWILTVAL